MAGRRLTPDEQALWGKVAQSVRPLPGRRVAHALKSVPETEAAFRAALAAPPLPSSASPRPSRALASPPPAVRRPVDYLDGGWERQIRAGTLSPDMAIDLHGHTLDTAHRHLETALSAAVLKGARVLLVVTGKSRPTPLPGERGRGLIRAEIGHWLATSPHADAIASIRGAHPRHGGAGAIYVILRRGR